MQGIVMNMERKRLTAIKSRIKSINSGVYVASQGFVPGYVLTSLGRLSRVRILATVVDKFVAENNRFASITLDDSSDTIRCKAFNSQILDKVQLGDMIDAVGKIRQYQGELYIVPEVVKVITDPNWEILRELEMRRIERDFGEKRKVVFEYQKQASDMEELKRVMHERFAISPEDVEAILQTSEVEEEQEENPGKKSKDALLKFIVDFDKGDGCDYSDMIEKSGLKEDIIDATINDLLDEGVCFEPKPGKIKKL
jgi:RPA family protein